MSTTASEPFLSTHVSLVTDPEQVKWLDERAATSGVTRSCVIRDCIEQARRTPRTLDALDLERKLFAALDTIEAQDQELARLRRAINVPGRRRKLDVGAIEKRLAKDDRAVFTFQEAADLLGVGYFAVYKAAQKGQLGSVSKGRDRRVSRDHLVTFVTSQNETGIDVEAP